MKRNLRFLCNSLLLVIGQKHISTSNQFVSQIGFVIHKL